jgi:murein DD-endopeptidase MepM/ murein hydrolase activator NlpD
MSRRILPIAAALLALAAAGRADDLVFHLNAVREVAAPDTQQETPAISSRYRARSEATPVTPADAAAVSLAIFPIGGTIGQDIFIPYVVDLDDSAGLLDFNCGKQTFNGHNGDDAYIRGFAEQDIGYPIFAVQDGVVDDLRDGQPDRNTNNDPAAVPNFVEIDHGDGYKSAYVHVRSGSILVKKGDHVVAGQQIAQIGSSGMSTGPHIHFQLTHNGAALEPFAGPCRLGPSLFASQPDLPSTTTALSAMFSSVPYDGASNSPFDALPHTGSYFLGSNRIYVRVDLTNLPANSEYVLTITDPNGNARAGRSAIATKYQLALASVWWTIDVPLDKIGTWKLSLNVNGKNVASMPFNVVSTQQQLANHPPRAATAALEPAAIRSSTVPVCRATGDLSLDPDYDVVRYHYVWTVNGTTVRDVTTAARSDALPRTFTTFGANIGCSITVSDASSSSATSTAFSNVATSPRRRAVAH